MRARAARRVLIQRTQSAYRRRRRAEAGDTCVELVKLRAVAIGHCRRRRRRSGRDALCPVVTHRVRACTVETQVIVPARKEDSIDLVFAGCTLHAFASEHSTAILTAELDATRPLEPGLARDTTH